MRRLIANELILSFVPNGEQRIWRSMTRMKLQLTRDRVRLQNQIECLLEEMRIKLSIVVSNLQGASGLRILHALAAGETDPKKLAQLGDERLQCTEEQLVDALTGRVQPVHGEMLALQLQRLQLIDQQMAELNRLIAQAMKSHQELDKSICKSRAFYSMPHRLRPAGVRANLAPQNFSRGLPSVTTAIWRGASAYRNLMRGAPQPEGDSPQNLIDIWQCGRRVGLFSRPHNFLIFISLFPFVECGWIEPPVPSQGASNFCDPI